jgi:geranylgeranyl pyrophosphate synthase
MQSQISTQQVPVYDSSEHLLDAVQDRMIECISPSTTRVSKKSTSALDAAAYHLCASGQRVRAKLALQSARALGLSVADAVTIAATVELLHNASLVHDDIQDCEDVRRGQKSVWVGFGLNTAICTGDLLLSAAYSALCKMENSRALAAMISLVHERTATAIDGQCADLRANLEIESDIKAAVARYEQIAIAKSGALLCLPIELALLAAEQVCFLPDARQAVEAFAISYQIVDDLNDVQNDTDSDSAHAALNIISVYKATGCTEHAVENAKRLGQHHLSVAIESAARLPLGAGMLLNDYAHGLRKVLAEQNYRY